MILRDLLGNGNQRYDDGLAQRRAVRQYELVARRLLSTEKSLRELQEENKVLREAHKNWRLELAKLKKLIPVEKSNGLPGPSRSPMSPAKSKSEFEQIITRTMFYSQFLTNLLSFHFRTQGSFSWKERSPGSSFCHLFFNSFFCQLLLLPLLLPPSPTPSATPSPTPSATPSPTPSATPSPTPSATPSPTPSATPSPSPSASPSPTPSASPSPTPSASPSPSPSASPSPSPSASPSPSPSASPSPSPSASPSPSPSASPFPSPSASPSPTPPASPSPIPSATPAAKACPCQEARSTRPDPEQGSVRGGCRGTAPRIPGCSPLQPCATPQQSPYGGVFELLVGHRTLGAAAAILVTAGRRTPPPPGPSKLPY
ncbi:hypothetical protein CEXT_644641 [Caerostris extrusa]|uniref:Uncharacterized protein n=1 Tax=Caerostris extrusa TaxID=172846 RepID=A0AAV4R8S4_CAEEX|nr:hypothetical protein CEXT_644641 [Caerostris extrusa]